MPWIHREWVPQLSSFPCPSLGGRGWLFSWIQVPFCLASLFLWPFSFLRFRKLPWLFEPWVCSTCTWILSARISPSLVCSHGANSMLGNLADSSGFPKLTFVGLSFLTSADPHDGYTMTFLVETHVCDQRNSSMFSKRPRHVAGASPLSLCVACFGEFLENGGAGWKKTEEVDFVANPRTLP